MQTIHFKSFDSVIHDLLFKEAWNVKIGYGSFLTMEFGKPIKAKESNDISHGEWHLWAYLCSWRIDKEEKFLVGSEDNRDKLENVVSQLEGAVLKKFSILNSSLDAELHFENAYILKLFSVISEDEDGSAQHWKLFMPNNKILLAGPGERLEVQASG